MTVYYIDELLLLNGAADYLLLLLTASLCGKYAPRWRMGAAALLGAVYSVFAAVIGGFAATPGVWLLVAGAMVHLAFLPGKGIIKLWGIFLLCGFLLGGAVYCLQIILARPGKAGFQISTLLAVFPACCIAAKILLGNLARNRQGSGMVQVRMTVHGEASVFTALVDTGNSLKDPVTGKQVLVAEKEVLRGTGLYEALKSGWTDSAEKTLANLRETVYASRLRLIPFRSIGQKGDLLIALRPDCITVAGKRETNILVAVSSEKISDGGPFQAILGVKT